MIRKQIYIQERQQQAIQNLAGARGISEAEVIRQAIDARAGNQMHNQPLDPSAWKRAMKLMRSLKSNKAVTRNRLSKKWSREELYDERLNRYGRSTH